MPTTFVRLVTPSNVTETGNGTIGWDYIGTTAAYFGAPNGGMGDTTMTADGEFRAIVGTITNDYGFILGADAGTATGLYDLEFGVYFNDLSKYKIVENGTPSGAVTNDVIPTAGDIMRLARTGSTVTASVSQDSGSTWTVVKVLANTSSATLNAYLGLTTNTQAQKLQLVTGGSSPTVSTVSAANANEGSPVVQTVTLSTATTATTNYASSLAGSGSSPAVNGINFSTDLAACTFSNGVTFSTPNLVVPSGVTTFTVSTPTIDDGVFNKNRTYTLTVGGTAGTGTINNTDAAPTWTTTSPTVVARGDDAVFTLTLSAICGCDMDFTADTRDGTAVAGTDYTARSGVNVTVLEGDLTATFTVETLP